jgi:two-component system, OmpR family, phosphate regulon sensor histidine kinase PhoR
MFNSISNTHLPKTIAIALVFGVLVPSACILWFMVEAMQNERLAAQQKIINIYQEQLNNINLLWENHWLNRVETLDQVERDVPDRELFSTLIHQNQAASLIIHSSKQSSGYPKLNTISDPFEVKSKALSLAKTFEFREKDYSAAIEIYQTIAQNGENPTLRARAYQAWSRCLLKIHKPQQALEILTKELSQPQFSGSASAQGRLIVANALLQARGIIKREATNTDRLMAIEERLVTLVNDYNNALPAKQRLFIMNRLGSQKINFPTHQAETLADEYLESVPSPINKSLLEITKKPNVWRLHLEKSKITALFTITFLQDELDKLDSTGNGVTVRLIPPVVLSNANEHTNLAAASTLIGESMPGWRLNLHLADSVLVDDTADTKIAAYFWIGMLLVMSIAIIGVLVSRFIFTQEKLHTLKNDLIATVTHELKTPLSSIRLFVELLLDEDDNLAPKTKEYLHLIDKENRRLTRLINNFLTFSRLDRNRQIFNFDQVSPENIINTAVEPFCEKFKAANFVFDLEVPSSLPLIKADFDLMVVVINNLLDNAYKYSTDNKYIKLTAHCADENIHFKVVDRGIGLTPQACKKIYDGFFRVDQKLTALVDGCGLGLNIAKYIVDNHRGNISVESTLGRGSTFTVQLPI